MINDVVCLMFNDYENGLVPLIGFTDSPSFPGISDRGLILDAIHISQ